MSDDESRFEEFVKREAQGYNAPPAVVPREKMWAAIEQARALGRSGAGAPGTSATTTTATTTTDAGDQLAARRMTPRRVWLAAAVGLAATLALGVGLGRMSVGGPERRVATVSAPAVPAASPAATGTESFDFAAAEHLSRAEALLTTYKGEERSRAGDRAINNWTKDMLSTTRLLLDSPAAKDAATRKLLEDLEVVLVQMVQLPASAGAEDRKMIERTLEHGQLLTRLRTVSPTAASQGS